MGIISSNQIKNITKKILNDSSIAIDVIYKNVSSTYSTTTRKQTEKITSLRDIKSLRSKYTILEINKSGGIIKYGDVKFSISADAFSRIGITPDQKDRINDGDRDWEIVNYKPIYIGNTIIEYIFQCR